MSEPRIPVPDPALMRRAGTRMALAMVVILILTLPFSVGGLRILADGDLPALPLAVGAIVLELCSIALVVGTFRVRRSLDAGSISREALRGARGINRWIRRVALTTIGGLLLFGLVRSLSGDKWSLLTACLMSFVLFFLASGTKKIAKAQDRTLAL